MAIPQAQAVIISRVNTIKTPDLTAPQELSIVANYAGTGVSAGVTDYGSISGNSRQVEYNASSVTLSEKAEIGIDKLGALIWSSVKKDGSTYINDGTKKFIVSGGTVYHYPAVSDFEDCVDLINHRIAHAVISDLGTTAETATALTSYNNFKATLS